ncbi:hypothetical protein IQ07DRAFT_551636 [Pyrenochaeta sp. DS3sAY3a]|nr:hypothetical protein IQ07DRAFT_551636 [Pyrenochaeta sp. DS3sAY3a]
MADFSTESPLAVQLQQLVQPKLIEFGWTTTGDDNTLFEYILLMLANDKNEAQVASELSNDLLDLGPDNVETQQFAHWLFGQIHALTNPDSHSNMTDSNAANGSMPAQDADMDGAPDSAQGSIPTGPKAMRNGSGAQSARPARGGRMLNQLNKNMGRDDSALHRVRGGGGGGGVGRINSHGRDPPRGPRNQNANRGFEAMANGRGMDNINMNMNQGNMNQGNMNGMGMGGIPGLPGMPPPMGEIPNILNGPQQMALMQMYEQQAQIMQHIFAAGGPQNAFVNPAFDNKRNNYKKQPYNQRTGNRMNPNAKPFTKKDGQDETMGDGSTENGDGMEVEQSRPEPAATMCRFNTRCTNPDCPFVHQSPAAPPGVIIDMDLTCEFGVACTNRKCVAKHPSPAQRQKFQSEQECSFWPNCRDPVSCPYKHPAAQPCRNGADCTTEGCTFGHSTVMCKFNPCLNARCQYKHAPGQKKSNANSNVWVAPGQGKAVVPTSERKFVDETKPEELILPGQTQEEEAAEPVNVES